jgi:TatD DNase family protein
MRECVRRGWYISFGGIISFKKSEELREVVRMTPEDLILVETDAPYLAPEPLRGSINTPANVKIVARIAAEARGISPEEIHRITTTNARRLFKI